MRFFDVLPYAPIASTTTSHPLIFEPYPGIHIINDYRHKLQDDESLGKFLKGCDLSGKRQQYHQQQKRDDIRELILKKNPSFNTLRYFQSSKCYESFINGKIDKYIKKHKLMDKDTYPILEKPTMLEVKENDYGLTWNYDLCVWEAEEEDQLLKDAAKADILYYNGDCKFFICKTRKTISYFPEKLTPLPRALMRDALFRY